MSQLVPTRLRISVDAIQNAAAAEEVSDETREKHADDIEEKIVPPIV